MRIIRISSLLLAFLLIISVLVCFSSCKEESTDTRVLAKFIGIIDEKTATKEVVFSSDSAIYQFIIDGEKETHNYCVSSANQDYSVHNTLIKGYEYYLTLDGNTITKAEFKDPSLIEGIVSGYTPGKRTLLNFLSAAIAPLGQTLYVYGGGWNMQDDGSGFAKTIGIYPGWKTFFQESTETYDYNVDTFPTEGWNTFHYLGLDCSGYIAWAVYNTLQSSNNTAYDYITSSTNLANSLCESNGLGTWSHIEVNETPSSEYYEIQFKSLTPGDIISIPYHVYIVLGVCDDGSVIALHATRSLASDGVSEGGGVQLSAISPRGIEDTSCEAFTLASAFMARNYPEWVKRYPVAMKDTELYFTFPAENPNTGIFSWHLNDLGLNDPEGIASKSASEVLDILDEIILSK